MVLHSLNYGTSHKLNTSPALFVLEGIQNHVACFKFISSSCQTIKWQPTLFMDNLTKKKKPYLDVGSTHVTMAK